MLVKVGIEGDKWKINKRCNINPNQSQISVFMAIVKIVQSSENIKIIKMLTTMTEFNQSRACLHSRKRIKATFSVNTYRTSPPRKALNRNQSFIPTKRNLQNSHLIQTKNITCLQPIITSNSKWAKYSPKTIYSGWLDKDTTMLSPINLKCIEWSKYHINPQKISIMKKIHSRRYLGSWPQFKLSTKNIPNPQETLMNIRPVKGNKALRKDKAWKKQIKTQ